MTKRAKLPKVSITRLRILYKAIPRKEAVGEETCEPCGYRSQPEDMEEHHIVPTEVTERAGMPESQTLRLCPNCHREVHTWYRTKVADIAYDPATKRFRAKSYPEMVKEYQSAFNSFVRYKKEQKKVG